MTPRATSLASIAAKPLVDFVEPVSPADQVVEVDLLLQVEIREDREIDIGPHRTVIGATDHLLAIDGLRGVDQRPGRKSRDADQHRPASRAPPLR